MTDNMQGNVLGQVTDKFLYILKRTPGYALVLKGKDVITVRLTDEAPQFRSLHACERAGR